MLCSMMITEAIKDVESARAAFLAAAAKATRPDCPVASLRYEELEEAENMLDALPQLERDYVFTFDAYQRLEEVA